MKARTRLFARAVPSFGASPPRRKRSPLPLAKIPKKIYNLYLVFFRLSFAQRNCIEGFLCT